MDELYMATFFLDEMYITAWRRLDFALLLELEGLVKFKEEPLLQAARVEDDVGNNVWAVNVMLRNDGGEQAELTVPFMRYRKI